MKRLSLSTVLITLNEETNIKNCLESVRMFSDEIIVLDSGSKDRTVEIAKQFGAKVFFRKFTNYAEQKNHANDLSKSDWIFSIDADEVASNELAQEILNIKDSDESDEYVAYKISRKNIIFGKYIKYSRWQPELDTHVWLFQKGKSKWIGDIHEECVVEGKIGKLNGYKIHYSYSTVSNFFDMLNSYSTLDAKVKNVDEITIVVNLFIQPIYNFLVRYIYRLGIFDGWRGFVLSYLMAYYHLMVWTKVWVNKNVK